MKNVLNDAHINLLLTLEELYHGVNKTIKFNKNIKCPSCNIFKHCPDCRGKGLLNKEVQDNIYIPAGVDNGMVLKFKNKGHYYYNNLTLWQKYTLNKAKRELLCGSLHVTIKSIPNADFLRQGDDVFYRFELLKSTIKDTDYHLEFKYLNGDDIRVLIQKNTPHGKLMRIKNLGFKNISNGSTGHLILQINLLDA